MDDGDNIGSDFFPRGDFSVVDSFDGGGGGGGGGGADQLSIDVDTLFDILDEKSDPAQSNPDDSLGSSAPAAVGDSFGHHPNSEPSTQNCSPVHTSSASLRDWFSLAPGNHCTERIGFSESDFPSCSTASSFVKADANHALDERDNLNIHFAGNGTDTLCSPNLGDMNVNFPCSNGVYDHSLKRMEASENNVARSVDFSWGVDTSSHSVTPTESTICHSFDVFPDYNDPCSAIPYITNSDKTFLDGSVMCDTPSNYDFEFVHSNDKSMRSAMMEFLNGSACSSSRTSADAQGENNGRSASEISVANFTDVKEQDFDYKTNDPSSLLWRRSFYNDNGLFDDKESVRHFNGIHSCMGSQKAVCGKSEKDNELSVFDCMMWKSSEDHENGRRNPNNRVDDIVFMDEDSKQSSGISPSVSSQKFAIYNMDEKDVLRISRRVGYNQDGADQDASSLSSTGGEHSNLTSLEQYLPSSCHATSRKVQFHSFREERENMGLSKVSPESIQSNLSDCRSHIDDDSDICILEDNSSQPTCLSQSLIPAKKTVSFPRPTYSNISHYSGGYRPKANNERLIFQAALQELSQPKKEASPPEGALAVPLLKHQRIALSWMVEKETAGKACLGGILADDQGLGKTISTIALILKERPSSLRSCGEDAKKVSLETLNLDGDDSEKGNVGLEGKKKAFDDCQVVSDEDLVRNSPSLGQMKGRPAAGTLVVCPTSVLRQWAEELQNKVTGNASLSVLVYHGSNRTKDPFELAKYDVVLTTYSIVSMEVPKQRSVDEDDEEKGKAEEDGTALPFGCSSSKKRKYPPSSDKRGVKHKKTVDGLQSDSVSRPLAKVAWFRVILDEAQSIKNHRTQVARACWGLRAKRRWCLSGTPIQNAIDDLYSYFRFLRHEPYSSYNDFRTGIKNLVSREPAKGYKFLQAILQTIMLRRTKGSFLDGKPIITLPPKVVELKKVEFTKEERDFYFQLETDSRAQFKEYADAGTVKQNYVNILLMLLRLRQACDHPLLVKGFDSNSLWRSSVEMAKNLPREKQTYLLHCLEDSLALCGICNDPPEDAVVTICGHVFCNQCICEHLTGDDNQCPATSCKVRLSMSSVFSKTTLNSSLYEQSREDCYSLGSQVLGRPQLFSDGHSYDSSKIRAVLEFLQSGAKPQDCTSTSDHVEKMTCVHTGDLSNGFSGNEGLSMDKTLNGAVKRIGEKAIVFSQWTRMLDLFEVCLKSSSFQYRRLDGTMSVAARDKAVKDFNTLPEVSVMIMSLKAASLGLNMVAACRVVLLDLWWNPTTEDQAIDRAHRIGQTRPVTVLRLTVKDTVEDRILALQQKKREMVASAFGEDETGARQTRLSVEDLQYLFMA